MDIVRKYQQLKLPSMLLKGLLAGFFATIAVAVITASLISVETIGEGYGEFGVMIALLLGSLASGLVASRKAEKLRFIMCTAGALIYFLALLCAAPILFDGVKKGVGAAAFVILGGGLTAGLLSMNKDKRHHYKAPKLRV